MLITDATWKKIRDQFTEQEKNELRQQVCGETICPPGMVLKEEGMRPDLWRKISDAKLGVR